MTASCTAREATMCCCGLRLCQLACWHAGTQNLYFDTWSLCCCGCCCRRGGGPCVRGQLRCLCPPRRRLCGQRRRRQAAQGALGAAPCGGCESIFTSPLREAPRGAMLPFSIFTLSCLWHAAVAVSVVAQPNPMTRKHLLPACHLTMLCCIVLSARLPAWLCRCGTLRGCLWMRRRLLSCG